jgi:uncharacterized protein DUF1737
MSLFGSKKVVEYKILIDVYFDHLQKKVNDHISNGWQPIGGVSSVMDHKYMQAMVKYK